MYVGQPTSLDEMRIICFSDIELGVGVEDCLEIKMISSKYLKILHQRVHR